MESVSTFRSYHMRRDRKEARFLFLHPMTLWICQGYGPIIWLPYVIQRFLNLASSASCEPSRSIRPITNCEVVLWFTSRRAMRSPNLHDRHHWDKDCLSTRVRSLTRAMEHSLPLVQNPGNPQLCIRPHNRTLRPDSFCSCSCLFIHSFSSVVVWAHSCIS